MPLGIGIFFLKHPEVEAYVPLAIDAKRQTMYNTMKVFAKLSSKDKTLVQALYEIAWGDGQTILKQFALCETDSEVKALWTNMLIHTAAATATGGELKEGREVLELYGAALTAVQQLNVYEANIALAQEATKTLFENKFITAEIKLVVDEMAKRKQRPGTFSLTLRLRGPKSPGKSINMPNRPPSDTAIDRIKRRFGFANNNSTNGNNSTDVINLNRGGHLSLENVDSNSLTTDQTLERIIDLSGGHQSKTLSSVGIELDEISGSSRFEQFISLIFRNKKKILLCAIIGSTLYLVFKKRRALRRFLKSFNRLFKPVYKIYKKIKTNRVINNGVTRRFLIFSRAISKLP